jgi:serine protease Do
MNAVGEQNRMTTSTKTWLRGAVAGLALVSMFGAGALLAPYAVTAQPIQVAPPKAAATLPSFADLVERVSPAVVSISVVTQAKPSGAASIPGFEDLPPELQRRFQGQAPQQPREGRGGGSGFFITSTGHIVTNNHVVEDAKEITVTLKDGREFEAKVVGTDERSDLAVLKVEGKDFRYVEFDTAVEPRVGDWVIAIGNPFGLGGTATAGIVSAEGRDLGGQYANFIQIDAPINPGNSGGPAFDLNGRVIGVNSAIFTRTGGNVGIGFAIPARLANDVTQQLMKAGKVSYGWLGVTIGDLNKEIAEGFGLTGTKGALIQSTTPGAPAAKAGLKRGDVVTLFNGVAVADASDLTRKVGSTPAGKTIKLGVYRDGGMRTIDVVVGQRPSEAQLADGSDVTPDTPEEVAPASGPLGLTLKPMTAEDRTRLRLSPEDNGVLITDVEDGSPADTRGLQAGMAILEAGQRPVKTVADFAAAVDAANKASRTTITLFVQRQQGGGAYVAIPLKK